MKKFIAEAWVRLTTDTPSFFNKLKVLGTGLAGTGMGLVAINNIPKALVSVGEHMMWIGGVIVAVSQFACTKTPEPPAK